MRPVPAGQAMGMPQPVAGQRRSNWSVIPARSLRFTAGTGHAEGRVAGGPHGGPSGTAVRDGAGPSRRWVVVLSIVGLLALAAGGYQTRQMWLAKCWRPWRPARAPEPPASAGLNASTTRASADQVGPHSTAVRHAVSAILEISGRRSSAQAIALGPGASAEWILHLRRQSERVDVKLILHQRDGQQFRDVTTFLGKLPTPRRQ